MAEHVVLEHYERCSGCGGFALISEIGRHQQMCPEPAGRWAQSQPMKVTTDYGVTSTAGEAGIVSEIFDRLGLRF